MAATKKKPRFTLDIHALTNGRIRKADIDVLDSEGHIVHQDVADLKNPKEQKALSKRVAPILAISEQDALDFINGEWLRLANEHRLQREQAAAGSAEAVAVETVELLDLAPQTIRRPLCLVNGTAYAAAWVPQQRTVKRSVDAVGVVTNHEPPLVTVEDVLLIVNNAGQVFCDGSLSGALPLSQLGIQVRLPSTTPPDRGWSGAGVKRFLAGDRPDPAEVFRRVVSAVNAFVDFARSMASQEAMSELTACYILASYYLDAFNVVGYLWPNGERGTGKTQFLHVVVELAYLGQLILAGSSYACLRDLADYGATLAFDDAEGVMDTKRTDPDKRTLLLAGNRRGATIAVKELEPDGKRWVTRHLNTFCHRLFSAIRLPDEVLGSRSIIVPLVRSGDERRAKSNPMDPECWPCDRRRLVDDLWAVGLAHLPELAAHDRQAAAASALAGRNLDPWRPLLAVAHWLQTNHGVEGVFDRMAALSVGYQETESGDFEEGDSTRILFRALLEFSPDMDGGVTFAGGELADAMNKIATAEGLSDGDKPFTTPKRVGWLLKRQRFKRSPRRDEKKRRPWSATRDEILKAASVYGVKPESESAGEMVDENVETPF